jgi:hypothetical protein
MEQRIHPSPVSFLDQLQGMLRLHFPSRVQNPQARIRILTEWPETIARFGEFSNEFKLLRLPLYELCEHLLFFGARICALEIIEFKPVALVADTLARLLRERSVDCIRA